MAGSDAGTAPPPWFASARARSWRCGTPAAVRDGAVLAFHRTLPGYAPSPLTEAPGLAAGLGAGRVFVKDESARLGLPAFKIIGASWAVHQLLAGGFRQIEIAAPCHGVLRRPQLKRSDPTLN